MLSLAYAKSDDEDKCKEHLFLWRREYKNKKLDTTETELLNKIDNELDWLLSMAGDDEVAKELEAKLDVTPEDNELRYQLAARYY